MIRDEGWAIIVAGLCTFMRAWFNYNFYLLNKKESSFENVFKFINNDKYLLERYWKIIPILEKAINVKSSRIKIASNICFILAWLAIIYFVICLFYNRSFI